MDTRSCGHGGRGRGRNCGHRSCGWGGRNWHRRGRCDWRSRHGGWRRGKGRRGRNGGGNRHGRRDRARLGSGRGFGRFPNRRWRWGGREDWRRRGRCRCRRSPGGRRRRLGRARGHGRWLGQGRPLDGKNVGDLIRHFDHALVRPHHQHPWLKMWQDFPKRHLHGGGVLVRRSRKGPRRREPSQLSKRNADCATGKLRLYDCDRDWHGNFLPRGAVQPRSHHGRQAIDDGLERNVNSLSSKSRGLGGGGG